MIGDIIKELRIRHQLTQETLAQKLHTTHDTISLWELNKRKPDADDIIQICRFFYVSTDYLLGLTEDDTPPWKTA